MNVSRMTDLLRIYNYDSQKLGQRYIDSRAEGNDKENFFETAVKMNNLIDSVMLIKPEDYQITGNPAFYSFTITGVGNHSLNMDMNITIGDVTYVVGINDSPVRTPENVASAIADYINATSDTDIYTATADGAVVTFYGTDFDKDNGIAVSVSITNGSGTVPAPVQLSGGVGILGHNIQVILDKLNSLSKLN